MRQFELGNFIFVTTLVVIFMSVSFCAQAMLRNKRFVQTRSALRIHQLQTFATLSSNELPERRWRTSTTTSQPSVPASQPSVPPPTAVKTMVFMDGTWLYYSMVQGRSERNCPIERKFGTKWSKTHRVDWNKLPQIIASNLREQLGNQKILTPPGVIDITRTSVFTSLRADTEQGSARDTMLGNFYKQNFDVHRFETKALQEKCVDIALAVEMLYMATVPGAFDIAVIVTGDKDFMPALEKTRLLGKRVAICSMRNGCNGDLVRIENRIRDFEMIWLDDYLDDLIVSKRDPQDKSAHVITDSLVNAMIQILRRPGSAVYTSRDMGRELQTVRIANQDALTLLKARYGSLRHFCERLPQVFVLTHDDADSVAFTISLSPMYHAHLNKFDSASSNNEDSDGTDSEYSESSSSDDEGGVLSSGNSKPGTQLSYSELLGRDDARPSATKAATISAALISIVREGFAAEKAEVLNSRLIGRILQRRPFDGFSNALIALKTVYANVYGFCEAHPEAFAVQEETDGEVGGFRVRLLATPPDSTSDVSDAAAPGRSRGKANLLEKQIAGMKAAGTPVSPAYEEMAHTIRSADDFLRHSQAERLDPQLKQAFPERYHELFKAHINGLKVPELREMLKAANLPHGGAKSALVERLLDAEKGRDEF